ncbi:MULTISPECIES: hypothetical protein [unclassified Nocardia]|uniref:hypothetical protein n=2 Tax=Nocardia TaxID=1817 RepID=UPI00278C2F62|nr:MULTISPECIES: hypothetical protein [unclassified Nocardia]
MTGEHDECRVTIDGVAPALVVLFRTAARIAAEHGRSWVGVEDMFAAVVAHDEEHGHPPVWWPRVGKPRITRGWKGGVGLDAGGRMLTPELQGETAALTYPEFRKCVDEWVPGPSPAGVGPDRPAAVTYEISGPNADEFRAMIERS